MNNYSLKKDWPLTQEQNEVIDYMLKRNVCINACQTGFGKTYTCLTALCWILLKYPDSHAICLIPQKALKAFKRELSEKLKISFNSLSSGSSEIREGARVTLITHTSLKKNIDYLNQLRDSGKKLLLLVDEAHALQDHKSKFYNLVASIRHYFTVCWFATATPLKNNIEGLYWMMTMLNPSILGHWESFKYKYLIIEKYPVTRVFGKGKNKSKRVVWEEEIIGYKNIEDLRNILDQYIIIKQKAYNLQFKYHQTELNDEEVSAYLKAGKGLLRETAKDNFAVRLHDLQMIVDNINEEYKVTNKLSSKEILFIKVIKEEIDKKHPVLVYCDYNDLIDRLELIINSTRKVTNVKQILKITGAVSLKEREKVEEQIHEGTVVLITSAGTESVNLQRANSIIFYDTPFSILTFMQAVGRVTRIDSKFSEQYVHIIECRGTIDSYKRCLIQINGGLIESMFGNMETLPLEAGQLDRNVTRLLKQGLLWCFKQGRLLSEEELVEILKNGNI